MWERTVFTDDDLWARVGSRARRSCKFGAGFLRTEDANRDEEDDCAETDEGKGGSAGKAICADKRVSQNDDAQAEPCPRSPCFALEQADAGDDSDEGIRETNKEACFHILQFLLCDFFDCGVIESQAIHLQVHLFPEYKWSADACSGAQQREDQNKVCEIGNHGWRGGCGNQVWRSGFWGL